MLVLSVLVLPVVVIPVGRPTRIFGSGTEISLREKEVVSLGGDSSLLDHVRAIVHGEVLGRRTICVFWFSESKTD